MANVVVVGAQWGDEGKGKIVDWLSERADVVVRFQGGHNAGHTLVIGDNIYKLSLLPSGVVRPGKLGVIGNGVVVDPWALLAEIEKLRGQGVAITRDNLRIAENATLILPLHRELDQIREDAAGAGKIGTTGRGIGPAYEDKVGRRAIRVQDLKNLGDARPQGRSHPRASQRAAPRPRPARDRQGQADGRADRGRAEDPALHGRDVGTARHASTARASASCSRVRRARCSTSTTAPIPFVTSSNTVAAQAATGSGMGPRAVGYVLGIAKAYTTRVGSGPFPTELNDEIGETHRRARPRVRHRHGAQAPLRLVRCRAGAPGCQGVGHRRHRADQARRARRLREDQGLRRLHARRRAARTGCRPGTTRRRALEPIWEDFEGWSQSTRGRAQLGRSAGAGRQIRAPRRGADRVPGDAAVDQPRARGHDPDERPVPGLMREADFLPCAPQLFTGRPTSRHVPRANFEDRGTTWCLIRTWVAAMSRKLVNAALVAAGLAAAAGSAVAGVPKGVVISADEQIADETTGVTIARTRRADRREGRHPSPG